MNAVLAVLVALAAVASANQYYVPATASHYVQPSTYQYVHQPSSVVSSGVQYTHAIPSTSAYAHHQYAVPSTQQYVYNGVPSTYYTSPVVSGAYNYGTYPASSVLYGKYVK